MLKLTSLVVLTALSATACSSSDDDSSNEPDNSVIPSEDDSDAVVEDATPDNDTEDGDVNEGDDNENDDNDSEDETDIDEDSDNDDPVEGDDDIPVVDNDPQPDTDDSTLNGSLTDYGVLTINEFELGQVTEATAFFYRLPQAIPAASIGEALGTLSSQDRCSVSTLEESDDSFPGLQSDDLADDFLDSLVPLSAGEVITLAHADGNTYGELVRTDAFGFEFYQSESDLVYPAPSPLVINIPGDEFAAFNDIQISGAAALTDLSGIDGGNLIDNSSLSWTSSGSPGAQLALSASAANGSNVYLDCVLVDDGSFTLPADSVAQLNTELGENWTLELDDVTRMVVIALQSGDAVLLVARTSE